MSASAKTMFGDLPPSSSDTRFSDPAASRMMPLPTSVDPVNAILSTPGCRTSAMPALPPGPGTTLNTPSGRPASCVSSAKRSAVSGVSEAGLRTSVFPAASAGAIFQEASRNGKFHGTIAPTTPSGWRSVKVKAPSRRLSVSPWIFVVQPA